METALYGESKPFSLTGGGEVVIDLVLRPQGGNTLTGCLIDCCWDMVRAVPVVLQGPGG